MKITKKRKARTLVGLLPGRWTIRVLPWAETVTAHGSIFTAEVEWLGRFTPDTSPPFIRVDAGYYIAFDEFLRAYPSAKAEDGSFECDVEVRGTMLRAMPSSRRVAVA